MLLQSLQTHSFAGRKCPTDGIFVWRRGQSLIKIRAEH